MLTLSEIQLRVFEIAEINNIPVEQYVTFGSSRDDGTPNIEIYNGIYYYIAKDRAVTCTKEFTQNLDELLYWIFCGVAFELGISFEKNNRKPLKDSRRDIFVFELDFLQKLSPAWHDRRKVELEEILLKYPYNDSIL